MSPTPICIGTAGWGIASRYSEQIPPGDSHLRRYSQVFNCTEIDTSFYRPHREATYARWAATTGKRFRFTVKAPRELTHEGRLAFRNVAAMENFASETSGLGHKLRAVLVQTPPALEFVIADTRKFFTVLRNTLGPKVALVCEPRHSSWSTPRVDQLLASLEVCRVAADPPRWDLDRHPGGCRRLSYWRLHGTPRLYYSAYSGAQLAALVRSLEGARKESDDVWCIFDNTAHGHAIGNALSMQGALTT